MKFEILDAEDNGDKITLRLSYDRKFEEALCGAFGVKYLHEEDIEDFVMMVLESITAEELRELGYEVDE